MGTLLDLASLVTIPSGYKVGTVYSVVPTDGAGDLSFTRSNDTATRVGPTGLIEKVRTNLFLQSQTFDNASWSKTDCVVTANAATAPDGTLTAEKLVINNGIGPSAGFDTGLLQGNALTTGTYTYSVFAKASEFTGLRFRERFSIGDFIEFNLSTGIAPAGTSTFINPTMVNVGNGWYRCSFVTQSNTANTNKYALRVGGTGDGTSGIFIWGAQFEATDFGATSYIPTTTTAVSVGPVANLPRLDYLNSTCPNLLLEPQRTNLITSSERFDVMSQSNLTVTANNATSPDGYTNADRLTPSGSGFHTIGNSISVTAGTPYTISFFYKNFDHKNIGFYDNNTSGSEISINVQDNTFTLGANVTAGGVISYGNGWYRAYATFSPSTTLMNNLIIFRDNTNNGNYTATGSYIWAYGWQVEAGSYATSYVPTLGAARTRGADACSKTGISSLIGQTQGSVFFDFTVDSVTQPSDPVLWYMKDGGSGERYVELYANRNLVYAEIDGGGPIATITKTGLTIGRHKCAIAYAPNDFTFYVDGVQIGTDTSGTPNGFSTFGFQYYLSAYTGQQKVNEAVIFPTRLSNSELAQLTTL
jgi:hypothetical protein